MTLQKVARKVKKKASSEWKSFLFLSEGTSYLQFYIEQKRHSKSFCIHVVLILYKTDVIIMTHKHFSNIIISRIDTSLTVIFQSLKSLFMFMDHKKLFRKITHDGSKVAPRTFSYLDFIHACSVEEFIMKCQYINQMMNDPVTVSDSKYGAEEHLNFKIEFQQN